MELLLGRERRVCVPGAPFGVFGEGLHDGQLGGALVDVRCQGGVFGGAWGREGTAGGDDDEADEVAGEVADEEEERCVDVGAEGAFGSWWERRRMLWWEGIVGVLVELLVGRVIGPLWM